MTDACLLIGLLDPSQFAGGRLKLHPEDSLAAFQRLDTTMPLGRRVRSAWEIGINNIVEGIYNVAVQHGVDPRDYSLVAYGAAGPMLLPSLLDKVRLRQVIVPPYPGLFSAIGLLSTELVYSDSRSAYIRLVPDAAEEIDSIFRVMEQQLLERIGGSRNQVAVERSFDGRLYGQSWDTPFIAVPKGVINDEMLGEMIGSFHAEYGRRHDGSFPSDPVEAVTFRIQAIVPSERFEFPEIGSRSSAVLEPIGKTLLHDLYDEETSAPIFERSALLRGDRISGPAVVLEPMSTTFVPADRTCTVGRVGELYIS
jgi:N-methylhydantoinase A